MKSSAPAVEAQRIIGADDHRRLLKNFLDGRNRGPRSFDRYYQHMARPRRMGGGRRPDGHQRTGQLHEPVRPATGGTATNEYVPGGRQLFSPHIGGANVLLCDASVHFLADTATVTVLAAWHRATAARRFRRRDQVVPADATQERKRTASSIRRPEARLRFRALHVQSLSDRRQSHHQPQHDGDAQIKSVVHHRAAELEIKRRESRGAADDKERRPRKEPDLRPAQVTLAD